MDTFELNKILGAILGSLLFTMGLGFAAEILYAPDELEQQAYLVEVEEEEGDHGAAGEEEEAEPLSVVLAAGDAERGQRDAKKCAACHTFEEGGPNKIGPNLHGVIGRDKASVDGFSYSDAMQARAGEPWSYEDLFAFLAAPKSWLPGTSMAFAGLKSPEDRGDVIAFLRSISPDAPPLPEPEQQAAVDPAAESGAGDAEAEGAGAGEGVPLENAAGDTEGGEAPAAVTGQTPSESEQDAANEPVSGAPATSEPGAPADQTDAN